ncbi:MAG: chromosome segregation protein SMC, partial [Oribacterium sp.]|nr:chromosome segregation protein SMC [Oribacterium sp.]
NLMGRKRELEELESTILSFEEKLEKQKKQMEMAEQSLTAKKAALEKDKAELGQLQLEENTMTLSIASELNVEYSSLSTRTDFVTENLHRLDGELEKVFTEKTELEDQQNNSDSVLMEKNQKIAELRELIANASSAADTIAAEIQADEKDKEALLTERKSFFGQKDEISERLLNMEKESLRVQNKKEKLDQKIDALTSYMFEEYNMTYQSALSKYSPDFDNAKDLRATVSDLKNQIRGLGSVNIDAIEQYKEISGRYEFLSGQYQDLIESEKSLEKVIEDLDRGMRKQFNEQFSLIQQRFNEVFKELFGGGQGKIELDTEDPDVLTTGISIIAEPPGKKLQNMMQLSGGEKALTAISLLFAIQSLKPSPFCLLDEIEAALDDSNVTRFAQYLHKLSETQFIVITHRRGTMENADRLFGITMQEKGVSTLVSVDLVADQLDA